MIDEFKEKMQKLKDMWEQWEEISQADEETKKTPEVNGTATNTRDEHQFSCELCLTLLPSCVVVVQYCWYSLHLSCLLTYCSHLSFYLSLKASGQPNAQNHPCMTTMVRLAQHWNTQIARIHSRSIQFSFTHFAFHLISASVL